MSVTRRTFLKAALLAGAALAWDAAFNGGRPASAKEQPPESGDEDEPQ